jgi:hypothetical protein
MVEAEAADPNEQRATKIKKDVFIYIHEHLFADLSIRYVRRRRIANPPKPTAKSERAEGSGTISKEVCTTPPPVGEKAPPVPKLNVLTGELNALTLVMNPGLSSSKFPPVRVPPTSK